MVWLDFSSETWRYSHWSLRLDLWSSTLSSSNTTIHPNLSMVGRVSGAPWMLEYCPARQSTQAAESSAPAVQNIETRHNNQCLSIYTKHQLSKRESNEKKERESQQATTHMINVDDQKLKSMCQQHKDRKLRRFEFLILKSENSRDKDKNTNIENQLLIEN